MVQAVATANVPKLTIIVGASHGAGNYAMCGRGYGPRFLFTWPSARISVMGAQQAAHVLVTVKQQQQQREAGKRALSAEEQRRLTEPILKQYEIEESPYFSTGRLWDDGILDPVETRRVIGLCLDVATIVPSAVSRSGPRPFEEAAGSGRVESGAAETLCGRIFSSSPRCLCSSSKESRACSSARFRSAKYAAYRRA